MRCRALLAIVAASAAMVVVSAPHPALASVAASAAPAAASGAPVAATAAAVAAAAVAAAPVAVDRLAGADRYETAARIALDTAGDGGVSAGSGIVVLASGTSFPDALAAAPLVGRVSGASVLLTRGSATPEPVVVDAIRRLGAREVVAVGGADRVSGEELDAITAATGASWRRVAGANREATAAAVLAEQGSAAAVQGVKTAFLATGSTFPDALAAGSPAASQGTPILLATRDRVSPDTLAALRSSGTQRVVLLGGQDTLSPAVQSTLTAAGYDVQRLAGRDRYETAAAIADWAITNGVLARQQVALARGDVRGGGADALAMGRAAAARRAPLLLTAGGDGPGLATAVWMQRNGVALTRIAVAGDEGSVTTAAVRLLTRRAQDGPVRATCPEGCRVVDWRPSDDPGSTARVATAAAAQSAIALSVGSRQVVWARQDGTVWGYGSMATDGPAVWTYANDPRQIVGLRDIVAVAADPLSGLALDAQGRLWQWNWWYPESPDPRRWSPPQSSYTTAAVHVADDVVSLSNRAAVLADGTVIEWRSHVQAVANVTAATTVIDDVHRLAAPAGMVAVSARGDASVDPPEGNDNLLMDIDGRVWTWAKSRSWDPGTVDATPVNLPAAAAIATGAYTQFVLLKNGTVASWGLDVGWIGRPPAAGITIPSVIPGLSEIVSIDAGGSGGYARTAEGALYEWGDTATDAWNGFEQPPVARWSRTPHLVRFPAEDAAPVSTATGLRYTAALFR